MIRIEVKDEHMETRAEGNSLTLLLEASAIVSKLDNMLSECHGGEIARHMFREQLKDEEFWKLGERAFVDEDVEKEEVEE